MRKVIRIGKQCLKFTLIELLIVIAIIAILASLLLPALNSARRKVYAAACGDQMRQTYLLLMSYAGDHDDYMPPGSHFATFLFQSGYIPEKNGKLIDPSEPLVVFRFPHLFLCPQLKSAAQCTNWNSSMTPLEWNMPTLQAAKTYNSWDPEWKYGWGQTKTHRKLSRFIPNSMILGDTQLEETCGTWYNSYSGAHQLCFYYVGTTITLGHGDRQNIVMFNGSVRSVKILPYTGTGDAAARVDFTMKR